MIGCTKLLCGQATVSEILRYGESGESLPPHMLQFSNENRPLVVWNMTSRCNLACRHCYIDADSNSLQEELTTVQAKELIDNLAEMKIPVLLFSGGEPLLRSDIFELGKYATDKGIRAVISSNGTLIDLKIANKIKDAGFQYVGVSIDGAEKTHDSFRQQEGCFHLAIEGIRCCLNAGVKAGIRFTVNRQNLSDLPAVLEIIEREKIPRFCLYHLVYAGRGKEMVVDDISNIERRQLIELLLQQVLDWHKNGVATEILTTDNHADGIFLYRYIKQHQPEREKEVEELLALHGGCSAGRKMANIDAVGNVHPCQFWQEVNLGNVTEQKFSEIWRDGQTEWLDKIRSFRKSLHGKCSKCDYVSFCGGCRIRAAVVHEDYWAEDPACYLTLEEIKKTS